ASINKEDNEELADSKNDQTEVKVSASQKNTLELLNDLRQAQSQWMQLAKFNLQMLISTINSIVILIITANRNSSDNYKTDKISININNYYYFSEYCSYLQAALTIIIKSVDDPRKMKKN
ncbi:unnamed protein product, partial [Thelazia callipaeda]|uniref:Transmembrane protein n=1 Tax=Thelazia callipaeda TaxID=103827 RepID=A0A0N5DA73_THECL